MKSDNQFIEWPLLRRPQYRGEGNMSEKGEGKDRDNNHENNEKRGN